MMGARPRPASPAAPPAPPAGPNAVIDPLFLAFGLALAGGGVASGLYLHRQRADDRDRTDLADWERRFRRGRYRRRMKVAGLMTFAGLAIPVGDVLLVAVGPKAAHPWLAIYLCLLLAAAGGMALLALLDSFATAVHTRDRVADVRARRVALEHDLLRLAAEVRARDAAPNRAPAEPRKPARNRLRDYSLDD